MLRLLPVAFLFLAGTAHAQLVEDEPVRIVPDFNTSSGWYGEIPGENKPGTSARPRIGPVGIALALDAAGKPTQCIVAKSSGAEEVDRAGCAKMMAQRFPAGTRLSARLWQFVARDPAPRILEVVFDHSKRPVRCRATFSGEVRAVPAADCKQLSLALNRAGAMTDELVYVPGAAGDHWFSSGSRR